MAPPTPTTTPMIVLRVWVDIPDVVPPLCEDRVGVGELVDSVVYEVGEPSGAVVVTMNVLVDTGGGVVDVFFEVVLGGVVVDDGGGVEEVAPVVAGVLGLATLRS